MNYSLSRTNNLSLENIIKFLFFLTAFSLPIYKQASTILIVLTLIVTLFYVIKTKNFLKNFSFSAIHISLMALYCLYAIGIFYTIDIKSGMFDLETKLSFLIIPILFAANNKIVNENIVKKIVYSFVIGTIASAVFIFSRSFFIYLFTTHNFKTFTYTNISFLFHPSYYALYLNFALIIIIQTLSTEWKKLKLKMTAIGIIISLFLFVMIFLVSSKAGILITLISLFILVVSKLFISKNNKISIAVFVSIAALAIITIKTFPPIKNRFDVSIAAIKSYSSVQQINPEEGTLQRIVVWKHSVRAIKDGSIFGYGTGSEHKILNNYYKKGEFYHGLNANLNCHNQYLQTTVSIGLFGFLALIIVFALLLAKGFKRRNLIIIFFALIVLMHFFVESMLETQAGIVFVAFMVSLLGIKQDKKIIDFIKIYDETK